MITKETITGNELKTKNEAMNALIDFYNAFNHSNAEIMEQNWSNSPEISMDNPLGGIKRGWKDIKSVYDHIFDGPAEVYVEFYDYSLHVYDTVFYAVGRERGYFKINGQSIDLAIRTSRIYVKENGKWKQTHHHGSIENPELLEKYQKLVIKS